ncbi:MAG: cation:proton antiporter [Thermoleophilia bacterium]
MTTFETYILVLGLLLAGGALLSGIARRSIMSLAIFFLVSGMVLGDQGFGVISLAPDSPLVAGVTQLTLIVILFVDGLEVETQALKRSWHVPFRSLIIAMPLTAALIAGAAHLIVALPWKQALLIGALLSPTDPVLTSSVVTNRKIPLRIRNSLNLESGFNDGLALPAVLIFATALTQAGGRAWWQFLGQDLATGAAVGLAGGLLAVRLLGLFRGRFALPAHYRTLYAFAVSLSLFGAARLVGGNGFITVYLAGIVMAAAARRQVPDFSRFSRDLGEILKLATFVIFGSMIVFDRMLAEGWRAVLLTAFVIFLARTLALLPSLAGTRLDWTERLFMAWFGPKGVACIAYSLLVLSLKATGAEEVFQLTALVVFTSIILHSASDTPLADWFGARSERLAGGRR